MVKQQLIDLVSAANTAGTLAHGPFSLFNPSGAYFDMVAPYVITDRGGWDIATTYNAGDQVTCDGYKFITVLNSNVGIRPLDATTGIPHDSFTWEQPWHSCYQRIRDELHSAFIRQNASGQLAPYQASVSGPWPCQNPSRDYDDQAFYYADTGNPESVTISGSASTGALAVGTFDYRQTELPITLDGSSGGGQPATSSPPGSNPTVTTAITGPPGQVRYQYNSATQIKIAVGGTEPLPINATFTIGILAFRGITNREEGDGDTINFLAFQDGTDPTSLVTIDTSGWIAGATFDISFSGWSPFFGSGDFGRYSGALTLTCTVNATVEPGIYNVGVTSTADPNNRAGGTLTVLDNGDGTITASGSNEWAFDTFLVIDNGMQIDGTISFVATDAVEVPGIHDSKRVLKIALPKFNPDSGVPLGLYAGLALYENADPTQTGPFASGQIGIPTGDANLTLAEITETPPYKIVPTGGDIALTFVKWSYLAAIGVDSITASTDGFWFGKTPPITSPSMIPFDKMPWNIFPTTIVTSGHNNAEANRYLGFTLPYVGGAFTGANATPAYTFADAPAWLTGATTSSETLPWPKRWKPLVFYPVGFTILDSYGNIQVSQTAGWSGTSEGGWPHTLGAITIEPTRTVGASSQAGATWKLTKMLRAAPSVQRNKAYSLKDTPIDDNGNEITCTVAGTTPATFTGTWATVLNATTIDGPVTWKLTRVNAKFNPAVGSIMPPSYPFFWQNPASNWSPNTAYAVGDERTDTVGNTQKVIIAGTSGATHPAWNAGLGSNTVDSDVTWQNIRLEQPPLTDTNADPSFPSGGHTVQFPFSFQPQGWWIYRVALNRIPQKKSRTTPPTVPVSVTLGCVRSGSFVAFGTYNTGQIIDAMWPIFTNTALAYQCSERVDVQAEIVTCGLAYSTWGNVSYPMAAAYINDMNAILPLL
jgi:hypothetical protein